MAKKPETLFKDRVIRDLKTLNNTWFVKIQMVARRGIPDLILCINGRFFAIELKLDTTDLYPLQELTLNEIARSNGFSFVANPKNWANTFDVLKELSGTESDDEESEEDLEEEECQPIIKNLEEMKKKH